MPTGAGKLADRLTASGHRLTAQRMIVADALAGMQRTVSAPDLYEHLRGEHPYLGRATVFRALDFLVEAGLAQRFEGDGHVHVYTSCQPIHHHHLVCRSCGSTTDIDDTTIDTLISSVLRSYDFTLDHGALDFFGTCSQCRTDAG